MKRILHIAALPALALVASCIDVIDQQWFNPKPVDEYELLHNEVPIEYIEEVSLAGTQVEGEDEAPTLAGIWAHQCLDDQLGCLPLSYDEFDSSRQSKTILYLHGNSNNIGEYWDRIQILWKMGYRVFAIDYRGYGRSTGTPTEAGVYADARTALTHVLERFVEDDPSLAGTDGELPNPLFLDLAYYGWSLGSTAAIDLSVEFPSRALVTEAALASGQGFIDDAASIGIHASVLMDARFDNVGKIPFVVSPKLFTHGLADDFVRFEFSQVLYDAADEPKVLFPVPLADHGNVPCPSRPLDEDIHDGPCIAEAAWLEAVGGFLSEHVP